MNYLLFYDETKVELQNIKPELTELYAALGIDQKTEEIKALEDQAAQPDFWNDMENSQAITRRTSQLKAQVASYDKLYSQYEDLETLVEMAIEEDDESVAGEIRDGVAALKKALEDKRLETLLSGEYDSKNAILTFHAGAGGGYGLGGHAVPDVPALGGQQALQGNHPGLSGRGGGWHQKRQHPD